MPPLLLLLLLLLLPVVVPPPPPFFWTEGWLIASEISAVVPEHWGFVGESRWRGASQAARGTESQGPSPRIARRREGHQAVVDDSEQAGTV